VSLAHLDLGLEGTMTEIQIMKLVPAHREIARNLFTLVAEVFGEEATPLGDGYLDRLLGSDGFWALAALVGDEVVGGITAHTLPMTRAELSELFVYDIAVAPSHQRRGIGRRLVTELRELATHAGIQDVFVLADDEDTHALDFYRTLRAVPSSVTLFSFPSP
jgi:aminoglycoside 3-N-acetyltransferase I